MTRTIKLYRVEIKYKDKTIVWNYGEPHGIEFLPYFVRISGVGIVMEYPYKGMLEFHMTTKDEIFTYDPTKPFFNFKGVKAYE